MVLLCELYGADLPTIEALAALAPKTKDEQASRDLFWQTAKEYES
ncbi:MULTISPECIES: hypothetical protein [unclassified Solwaraspora]|nr:hypothetical protein [Solwaraspora sp. WMMA2056]WJK42309.1 hypothetical protein O7608_07980 [Solwaraspora sp. WMMA2056]